MKKLLFLTALFVISLLILVIAFRAILPSRQSLQIQPQELINISAKTDTSLQRFIQLALPLSLPDSVFCQKIKTYLSKSFPSVDTNPNIELSLIDSSIFSIKWIGRNETLPPHIWVHSPSINHPPLLTLHQWDYDPMMGKIIPPYIYGLGSNSEKSIFVAQLTAIERFISDGFLSERTFYLLYPKNYKQLNKIWDWLLKNEKSVEQILISNAGIQNKDDYNNAYIGTHQSSLYQITNNEGSSYQLPTSIDRRSEIYQYIHNVISQYSTISENLILQNEWIFGSFSQDIIAKYIHIEKYLPLVRKNDEGNLTLYMMSDSFLSDDNSQLNMKFQCIHSSIFNNIYFNQIKRSICQSFPDIRVYPSFYTYNASLRKAKELTDNIYFFSPARLLHHLPYSFDIINERIAKLHLHRTILFYDRYVKNCQN